MMNREEAIEHINIAINRTWKEKKCNEILDALKQEPCEDCISKQAAIDAIKNYASMLWEKYHEPFPKSTIMEMIQALPPVTPAEKVGQWIPVGERLPKDDTEVLITYIYSGHEIVNVAWINNREWYYRNDILLSDVKVIAWMPLPEPMRLENK